MFDHRFSKFGKAFLLAVCLLFMGGMQQSCKDWLDDYKYDDSEPEWLGASVYAFLQEGTPNHTYKNYVELIDSLGEKEVLGKTGSKTLFVADDAAFERFYANNSWGVKSVADMSVAQRKYLFYNTMLPNAILLDMMPSTSATTEGDCIAHETEFNSLDSVPRIHADYYPLHPQWPSYNKYWELFASKKDTLLVAMTTSNMVHFFEEYLKKNAIAVSDIDFLFKKNATMAKDYKAGDVFLYGNKLVDGEVDAGDFSEDSLTIVCKNGYVYRMDEVLLPPMDMASELRTREDTRIFSHLLDRFCIPVFDSSLTGDYRDKYNVEGDSVFGLRYFTKDYNGAALFNGKGVSAPSNDECLAYDPAASQGKNDVYAMLVPKDEVLYEYFATGSGESFIDHYASDVEVNPSYSPEAVDGLLVALDSIPQVNIATFLNNLMQTSFSATVPSKFDRITNDANDDMKIKEHHVDECLVANNGVIYLLNEVFSPAQFSSVLGPVDIYDNMRIMKKCIKDLKYNYYLLAMDAKYSLIIPDDNHFVYYDPTTYKNYSKEGKMVMYSYHYDSNRKKNTVGTPELWHSKYEVDDKTFEIDTLLSENTGYSENIITDILEYLIIVHDSVEPTVHADRLYYSTKGYGTIKIDATDSENIKFYGGEQLENGTEIVSSMIIEQENGYTYSTTPAYVSPDSTILYSSVPTPPTKSVYQNMLANASDEESLYYEFYNLCSAGRLSSMLSKIYPDLSETQAADTLQLYSIFYNDSKMTNCVPFLNTYHYTVYIPSNESIKELYAKGLPTWEMVTAEVEKNPKRAMSLIRSINNFIRYHFQDYSVFHDRSPFYMPNVRGGKDYEASFSTSLINPASGRFYNLDVKSADDNSTILVKDEWAEMGKADWAKVVNTSASEENKTWNVMCRDRIGKNSIETSSYSVLQPIDRALLNANMFGFDGNIARYAITGECVDTMYVSGGKGGDAGFSDNCYLVADAGRVPRSTTAEPQPAELENKEVAYLMKRIAPSSENWDDCLAHEELVLGADELPILITREGYRVIKTEDLRAETVAYEYYTELDAEGNQYLIKVNNAGEEIGRTFYKAVEEETPEDGENGSNGETSDEE